MDKIQKLQDLTRDHGRPSLKEGIAVVAVLVPLYYILRAIYRITLHPLRRFSGPTVRAISHLPQSIGSLKGREAFNVRDLHRQYGEVVRVAPDLLSFATATAWSDIHGHGKGFTKYGYFEVSDKAQPLLTANDKDYTRQRATLAHGFSERAIIGQETALRKNIDQLLQKLGEKATKHEAVNIGMWMDFLTFDIIGEFTLNTQFGCVKNSQNHPWVSLMIKFMHAVGKAIHATAFGIFAPFILLSINRKDLMGMKTHLKLSSEKVRERIEMGEQEDKADLWTYVLRNKGDQSMSLPEMEVNAAFLLSASTAPMSDVICGALYLLAKHPEALATLRRELESTFTSDKEITISATAKLPYLRGILDETMRYYTPFPGGARRQAPPGGAYVSGYFVPGKAVVAVYQFPTFTSKDNFALPDRFLPSRWLPANHPDRPKATLSDKQNSFQPFGYGPKACLGKGLAYAELKLILARFIWNIDFELLDDGFALEEQKSYLFRDRPPLSIKLSLKGH